MLIPFAIQAQPEVPPTEETRPTGLLVSSKDAFEGYTLYAPLISSTAYLLDINGEVVKT